MKFFHMLLFCGALLLIMSACTGLGEKNSNILKKDPGGEVVHNTITIKPSGSYEECIELPPGMVFDYEFRASRDVNFNIHYHSESDIHYPVKEMGVKRDSGMIDPAKHDYYTEEQEFYCLMWDNVNYDPVRISFTCTLRKE